MNWGDFLNTDSGAYNGFWLDILLWLLDGGGPLQL